MNSASGVKTPMGGGNARGKLYQTELNFICIFSYIWSDTCTSIYLHVCVCIWYIVFPYLYVCVGIIGATDKACMLVQVFYILYYHIFVCMCWYLVFSIWYIVILYSYVCVGITGARVPFSTESSSSGLSGGP